MARGVTIPITLNPRDFLRGIKQVEVGLDGLTDDLRRVERSGDGLGDSLQDEARQAERAFERFGDSTRRELDRLERAADDVDLADGLAKGKGRVGQVGAEIADEFTENFGEAVRSGNPADALLETFTSLGPAFGVAGLAVAAGAGIINAVVQGAKAEAARLAEVSQAVAGVLFEGWQDRGYQAGYNAGEAALRGLADSQTQIAAAAETLGLPVEQALLEIDRLARESGLSVELITAALSGSEVAAQQVAQAQSGIKDRLADNLQAQREAAVQDTSRLPALKEQERQLRGQLGALGSIVTNTGAAVQGARDASTASQTWLSVTRSGVVALGQAANETGRLNLGLLQAARNSPDFSALSRQLGYAAANAQLLSAALGTVTSPSQLQGVARGALMR